MAYDINSQNLVDYAYKRIVDLAFKDRGHRLMDLEKGEDSIDLFKLRGGKVITHEYDNLKDFRGDHVIIKPFFNQRSKTRYNDKIEIAIEPYKAGINGRDVCGFLESFINRDQIFSIGNPLFSHERKELLPFWQKTLKREYESCQSKMSCLVTNQNISSGKLKKAFYEYMVRPCVYYLFNIGKFSEQ